MKLIVEKKVEGKPGEFDYKEMRWYKRLTD